MNTETVRGFVASVLTDEDRVQMIQDSIQLEQDGYIGDCVLRKMTSLFTTMNSIPVEGYVMLWMNTMMTEVYRYYALKHLNIEN